MTQQSLRHIYFPNDIQALTLMSLGIALRVISLWRNQNALFFVANLAYDYGVYSLHPRYRIISFI